MQIKLAQYAMHQERTFGANSAIGWRDAISAMIRKSKRLQLFGVVVLLHIVLIYALQNGLLRQVAHTVPAEVFATLISTESIAPQPKISPAVRPVPKTVPVTEPAIAPVTVSTASETPVSVNIVASAPAEVSTTLSTAAAPSVPVAPVAAQPKTISSGVEYIRAPRPAYPLASRRIHEQGKTLVRVLVNEQGMPAQAEIQQSSGSARLDEAAKLAVLGALFKPFIENGKAMTVFALVPIRFQLDS